METEQHALSSQHFTLHRLADGVYAALYREGGLAASNAGIVDLGDRTLVFDTFFSPQAADDLRAAAEYLTGRPVSIVVNSHWHHDHVWGNQAFAPETYIVASHLTRNSMATKGIATVEDFRLTGSATLASWQAQLAGAQDQWQRRQCANWVDYFRCSVEAEPILQLRLPDLTFDDSLTVVGSRRSAELLAYAGHTESDLILFLPEDGIVFMGDLLFVGYQPYLGAGNPDQILCSLSRVSAFAANTFVPGHGPVGGANDLALQAHYVEALQTVAEQLVESGQPQESVADVPIPPPFEDWLYASFFPGNLRVLYEQAAGHGAAG